MARILQLMLLSKTGAKNMTFLAARVSQEDLRTLSDLLSAGKVKSVIDRCYPLEETAKAIRYLEDGHARGKIVITVS